MDKILLLDMSNLFYRAYYTNKKVTGRKGVPCGGIFGSICMLDNILSHFKPQVVVCCWDLGKCFRRLKIYPQYKEGRRKGMEENERLNIEWQMSQLREVLSYTPVRNILIEGIEADDVIGYLAQSLRGLKIIISNDHDYIQCVSKNVQLFIPAKSKSLTLSNVDEFLDYDHKKFLLWKCLVGDASDAIRGIFKVGPVKAAKIINEGQKLKREWKGILERNMKLMTVGSILTDKDKIEIRKQYSTAKLKLLNNQLTIKLGAIGLLNILKSRYNWTSSFEKIRRS